MYVDEICGNQIYFKLIQRIIYLRRDFLMRILNVPGAPVQLQHALDTFSQIQSFLLEQPE